MIKLTPGKYRGLQKISTSQGTITALALDHRQNLRRSLNPNDPSQASDADLTRFKMEVTAALADQATAVLLDPEYSAAQALAAGLIPKQVGLVVALESTGYTGDPDARGAQILPGWSVEKAKRMGADAIKLLVYYHPKSPTAAEVEAFVRQVAAQCQQYDLALMLEPLSYSLDRRLTKLPAEEKHDVVVETARRLTTSGADILKAEFPLDMLSNPNETEWIAACAEISSASAIPWILLSAAIEFDAFLRQVKAACQAGASGIAVGRAVWQEAVKMDGAARLEFLRSTGRDRLARLTALCTESGRSITDYYRVDVVSDWYKPY